MLKTNNIHMSHEHSGIYTAAHKLKDPLHSLQHHTQLFVNTEHHPSIHRADSFPVHPKRTNTNDNENNTTRDQGYTHHHHLLHQDPTNTEQKSQELEDDLEDDVDVDGEEEDDDDDDDDDEEEEEEVDLRKEEDEEDYRYGGYHPVSINERFGDHKQYRIVRKLGWGHFSTVWLAYEEMNNKHVAIKIVRSKSNYTQAALDEIKILDRVNKTNPNHPGFDHLVKMFDWFYHEGPNGKHVCMVFEVLGENMLGIINKFNKKVKSEEEGSETISLQTLEKSYGGLPISVVKKITKQLFLALDYLHRECGLIHTDIKPENILIEIKNVEKFVKCLKLNKKLNRRSTSSSLNSNKSAQSSYHESPIKCSKPLPSPLLNSNKFDFKDYFSNYQIVPDNQSTNTQSSLNSNNNSQVKSNSSSIKYYEDSHDPHYPIQHQNHFQSSTVSTSPSFIQRNPSHLSSLIVSASEANSSDDEEEEEDGGNKIDESNEYVDDQSPTKGQYNESSFQYLNSRISSFSIDEQDNDLSSWIDIKLADLGNACYYDLHYTNDIQTRQYRSPEVLLGHRWGCSTDVWSVACLIFELITGEYLFDPKNGKHYNKDDDHLAQIMELLEINFHQDKIKYFEFMQILRESKFSLNFFHSDLINLRRIKNLNFWNLENVLIQKYKMEQNLAQDISGFLTPMLTIDPMQRVDLGGWSNHDWLTEVKNCGHVERPVGQKGEDIKGWFKRYRTEDYSRKTSMG